MVFIKKERNVKMPWTTNAPTDPPSLPSPDVDWWDVEVS